jgi:hypothetical protein
VYSHELDGSRFVGMRRACAPARVVVLTVLPAALWAVLVAWSLESVLVPATMPSAARRRGERV